MTIVDLIVLAFILLFFGGISGIFTFVSLQLIWQRLEQDGVSIEFDLHSDVHSHGA
jgi:hypothetical protein